jgi:hypothetical protein
MASPSKGLRTMLEFPLPQALFGRRARRFGVGMEIPSGPLAFRSDKDPLPLSELEQTVLVAAATGVSGWSFGVPFGPRTPEAHAEFTLRFTGRTAPTAAGLGTPALFFTDDHGCYCTRTRDVQPHRMQELDGDVKTPSRRILAVCREHTIRIRDERLDLPSTPPYVLPPNLWWANKPGSTLFMPVGDASEECLGLMALMMRHGVMVVDHETGKPAGTWSHSSGRVCSNGRSSSPSRAAGDRLRERLPRAGLHGSQHRADAAGDGPGRALLQRPR